MLRLSIWAAFSWCARSTEVVDEEDAKLYAGSSKDDGFGNAVSVSGDLAIVAAPFDDSQGEDAGAAFIFAKSQGFWEQEAKLTASDAAPGDNFGGARIYDFGGAVSIAGDVAVVGAPKAYIGPLDKGAVYVFRRTVNGTWSQEDKLVGSDSLAGNRFGISVALSEDASGLVVGADWHTGPGGRTGSGAAYIFKFNGTAWNEEAKLVAHDGAKDDRFGTAVDISGATAIVGAIAAGDGYGAAYLFERNSTGWFETVKYEAEYNASDPDDAEHKFGSAVAVSDNVAIVGAYHDDELAINAGAAFIYTRYGDTWDEGVKVMAPDGSNEERFGISVDVSGNMVIIGSNFDSNFDEDDSSNFDDKSGSAFIYIRNLSSENSWLLKEKLVWSNASQAEYFGRGASIWDSGVGPYACLVGAPGANSSFIYEGDLPTTTTSTTSTSSTTTTTSTTTTSSTVTSTNTTHTSTSSTVSSTSSSTGTSTSTATTATSTSSTSSTETVTTSTATTATTTSSTATYTTATSTSQTFTTSTQTTATSTSSTASTETETQTTSTATTFTVTTSSTMSLTMTETTITTTTMTGFLAPPRGPPSGDDDEESDPNGALAPAAPTAALLLASMVVSELHLR